MSFTTQNNSRDYGGLPRADDPYSGHLWRLATLRRFLTQEAGLDWDRVWAGLVDTVRWGAEYHLVLQKVPSKANPKVRNHGEGPY